jgi:hypothetical protein
MSTRKMVIDKTTLSEQWAQRHGAKEIITKRIAPTQEDMMTNFGNINNSWEHDDWLDYQDEVNARMRKATPINAYYLKIEMPEIKPAPGKNLMLNDYAVVPAYYESIAVDEVGQALQNGNVEFLNSQRGQRLQTILREAGYQF